MKTLGLCVLLAGALSAQEAKAPTLTEVQRLQLQNAVQAVELAQLRLQALITSFTPTGYQINERFELVPAPVPANTP